MNALDVEFKNATKRGACRVQGPDAKDRGDFLQLQHQN
jgi:hypothetical protein